MRSSADALAGKLGTVEQEVYQVKNQSNQDPLNFPIKLNNKIAALAGVAASGPYAPTDQSIAVLEELSAQLKVQLDLLQVMLDEDLKRFNEQARQAGLEPVVPKAEEPKEKKPVMTMDEEEMDDHIMYTESSAAA